VARVVAALGVVFFALHLPFLAPTLEDIDSINFALGVRDFDIAHHRPHPPGYPLFVALGKLSTTIGALVGSAAAGSRALAFWSAAAGGALVFLLFSLFRYLDGDAHRAAWAAAVAAASPLFWFTAARPLSDMTGLAMAVGAQVGLVAAMRPAATGIDAGRALTVGAFLAGLSIGVRSQTFLLTLPLLALALAWSRVTAAHRLVALFAAAVGVLLWAIPLIVASGGVTDYLAALASQAGEDFSGVVMLWTTPTPRVAVDAVLYTFLWPWGSVAAGAVMAALAVVGLLRRGRQAPALLLILAVAFAPYTMFHLLFQETATVRYALPVVIPVAFLAVQGIALLPVPVFRAAAAALVASGLIVAVPASVAYGREGSPAFRLFDDLARTADGAGSPTIAMHAAMRRVEEWYRDRLHGRVITAPHGREWLALVDLWKQAPAADVLFAGDPRRTDLVLFDSQARKLIRSYRWTFPVLPYVGGARPGNADLYAFRPPGWMLDRGWALTPEVAGVSARDGLGPHIEPSVAWIKARGDAAMLMIGGRNLGAEGDPAARLTLHGQAGMVHAWDVPPGSFFHLFDVAPGSLNGQGYVPLRIRASAADMSGRQVPVALEQFDVQPERHLMWGFASGWNEPEFNPVTARSWRWTTESAELWVRPVGRDLVLRLTGESPRTYFDRPSDVRIRAAGRELARFSLASDFDHTIVLPEALLRSSAGRVTVEADQWFAPADRGGSADRRHLALRVYSVTVAAK
jgi:hypothetical protein